MVDLIAIMNGVHINYGRPKNRKYSPSAIIATTPIIVSNTFNVN